MSSARSWATDSAGGPGYATMGAVTTAPPLLCLVIGDEELLATRAVTDLTSTVRALDPEVDVRELEAAALVPGELAELLSPSLFGGRRGPGPRHGQDAKEEPGTALLEHARDPHPAARPGGVHA